MSRCPRLTTWLACIAAALRACIRGRLRAGRRVVAGVRRHLPGRGVHRPLPRFRHAGCPSIRTTGRRDARRRPSRSPPRPPPTATTTARCAATRSSMRRGSRRRITAPRTSAALGGNRYAADGTLCLHGVSKPVTFTFTWTPGAQPGARRQSHRQAPRLRHWRRRLGRYRPDPERDRDQHEGRARSRRSNAAKRSRVYAAPARRAGVVRRTANPVPPAASSRNTGTRSP